MVASTLLMKPIQKVVVFCLFFLVQDGGKSALSVVVMLVLLFVLQLEVTEELFVVLEEEDGALGGERVLGR